MSRKAELARAACTCGRVLRLLGNLVSIIAYMLRKKLALESGRLNSRFLEKRKWRRESDFFSDIFFS